MKRMFLEELGLEKDAIDKIMAQNGADIEKYKSLSIEQGEELARLREDLKARDEQLETLKNGAADVETLKQQIEALQAENKTAAEKYQGEIKQMKINNAVEKALTDARAKNNKVVLPLLSEFLSKAEFDEQGNIKDLDSQIKSLAESEETKFLFNIGEIEKPTLKGIVPGSKAEPTGGSIDQSVFNANKNNPDWINQNWETISTALQNGTIKN